MNRIITLVIFLLFLSPLAVLSQQVTYSDYDKDDGRDMNFEIIGKMNGHYMIYKNIRWKHRLCIYDDSMQIKETIDLDFFPEKTLNVDIVAYANSFYMIYQFQKKNIVHCMGVKMDGNGKKIAEPIELDTTKISFFDDNKIYNTINSDDKKRIMVFKVQKKNDKVNFETILFDDQLQLIKRSYQTMAFEERRETYREFLLDNDGTFVFSMDKTPLNRDYSNVLQLVTKTPAQDTFAFHSIDLQKKYVSEVKLKIDNLNKRYLLNSFYYSKNRGSVDGLFSYSWDKANERLYRSNFTLLDDSLRSEARKDGSFRVAFDDYFIRQVIVKKDGGYLLIAEDFSSQGRGNSGYNPWNRWDYYNNPYSLSPSSYYYYSPSYGYYRPYNNNNFSAQSIRYFYENICVLSIDKNGNREWNNVIHKTQYDDDNENFLSYALLNSGDAIHFLFNSDNKNQIIADFGITANGTVNRNPTLRSHEKGYQFMTQLGKQVSARVMIVPCIYRGYVCFAKVEI